MKKMIICLLVTSSLCAEYNAVEQLDGVYEQLIPAHKKNNKKNQLQKMAIDPRDYYDSLVYKASKPHWSIPITTYFNAEDDGFNCEGCSAPLSGLVFGKCPITFKDIYLFSKLSDDNMVRIMNCNALAPERGDFPIGRDGKPFGAFRDDLYTTLLAPVQLRIDGEVREYGILPSFIFHFDVGQAELFSISLGATVPFKTKQHIMDIYFENGELFRAGFVPDTTQMETSIGQFYRDYTDVEDFFYRAILGPKGLMFEGNQLTTGLGDISVFGIVEYHNHHDVECGVNFIFPTAAKGKQCNLWEPVLGNGGAFQFDPFIQALFTTSVPYVNPFIRIVGEFSAKISNYATRAPTLVSNDQRQMVHKVPGLEHPSFFDDFYVDAFQEYDTCVPLFADKVVCIDAKIGNKVMVGIGNYAYQLFNENFRWGLFYNYMYKTKDSYAGGGRSSSIEASALACDVCDSAETCATCMQTPNPVATLSTVDLCRLEHCTNQESHSIGTTLIYKFKNRFELSVGGDFIIAGKNVPKRKTFLGSFVIVF
jgi:hypothetical protein